MYIFKVHRHHSRVLKLLYVSYILVCVCDGERISKHGVSITTPTPDVALRLVPVPHPPPIPTSAASNPHCC